MWLDPPPQYKYPVLQILMAERAELIILQNKHSSYDQLFKIISDNSLGHDAYEMHLYKIMDLSQKPNEDISKYEERLTFNASCVNSLATSEDNKIGDLQLKAFFINGLKTEIKREVLLERTGRGDDGVMLHVKGVK